MRIAFVISHINTSTQWVWFSEELQRRNIPFLLIIINDSPPLLYEDLKARNVEAYYLQHKNKFSFFTNLMKTIKIFRDRKVDIVHTEMPYGNIIGQTAAFMSKIKMRITTCENTTWFFDFNSLKQEVIDRYTYLLAKRIIALTHESYEFLNHHFKISPKRLSIIHHSLKTSDYLRITDQEVEELREKLQIPKDIFVIGMVARFEFWKGHIYAIEAMERLAKEFPNVRLLIFGSKGESYENLMKQIKKRHLEDVVIYKGFIHNNISLYRLFDVHLHIPIKLKSETFGINIMEGMISGCAQVLTLSGISTFTARDNRNCLVVSYQSSESVYKALRLLITDDELRHRLGSQAKADAIKHFKYEEKVDLHLKVYEELKSELKL